MSVTNNDLIVSHQLAWGIAVCDVISAIGWQKALVSYVVSCACF